MKAVILAGGMGTRLSEETVTRPKPMVEVGGKPILWHIMKVYSHFGITEFVICLGYRGYMIKEYFANYFLHLSDVTFDIARNAMTVHQNFAEPWKVTLVDTGNETMTGGRLKRIASYTDGETFLMTYGDGIGDIDVAASVAFHRAHKRLATITATQPPGRFGRLVLDEHDHVTHFEEKPVGDGSWINGGFFVLEPSVFDYIHNDATIWEQEPLRQLARDGQLAAYRHGGFWLPMDTVRDRTRLEELWSDGKAPWKIWADGCR
ncbi:MAG: glucose-1-phosphate cytidylyltransferase [Gemmatimonadaceae bacterium]